MADDLQPPDDLIQPPSDLASAGPPSDLISPPPDLISPGSVVNDHYAAKPPAGRDPGLIGALTSGIGAGIRGVGQTAEAIGGGKPQVGPEDSNLAAEPMTWGDMLHPKTFAEKTLYGLGSSAPTLAGGIAGGVAGAAIPGAGETGVPELVGAAAGAGAGAMAQSFGPYFAAALKENPGDPDAAWSSAMKKAAAEGGISAVGWAAFHFAPFQNAVKNLLFQAFGVQPAVSIAGHAATNVAEGRPATEGLAEEYPGAVAGTIVPAVGMSAAHYAARRVLGDRTPATAEDANAESARDNLATLAGVPSSGVSSSAPGAFPAQPPPTTAPPVGARIGLTQEGGAPAGATVQTYFGDGGRFVRLQHDDGHTEDTTVSSLLKSMTPGSDIPPPPAATGERAPPSPLEGTPRSMDDEYREWLESADQIGQPRASAQTLPLLGAAQREIDFANNLLASARNPMSRPEDRPAYYAQAMDILTKYGVKPGEPLTPESLQNAQTMRAAQEAAARLGELGQAPVNRAGQLPPVDVGLGRAGALGQAAASNPEMYGGQERVPFVPEPRAADQFGPAPVKRPMDLLEFLARNGGIQPDGDLLAMDAQRWHIGQPFMPRLVKPGGLPLDEARRMAQEEGYIPPDDPRIPPQQGVNDFLETIRDALGGEYVHTEQDRGAVEDWNLFEQQYRNGTYREQLEARAQELGIEEAHVIPTEDLLAEIDEREAMEAEHGSETPVADRIENDMDRTVAANNIPWFDEGKNGTVEEPARQPEAQPSAEAANRPTPPATGPPAEQEERAPGPAPVPDRGAAPAHEGGGGRRGAEEVGVTAPAPTGLPEPPTRPPEYGANNKIVTKAAYEAARARLREKMGRLNAGLDPEMMLDGMTMAAYHFESGARAFPDFAREMLADVGEKIRPHLAGMYEYLRRWPDLDTTGISAPEEVERFLGAPAPETAKVPEPPAPVLRPRQRWEPTPIPADASPEGRVFLEARNALRGWVNGLSDADYQKLQQQFGERPHASGYRFPTALADTMEPEKQREAWGKALGDGAGTADVTGLAAGAPQYWRDLTPAGRIDLARKAGFGDSAAERIGKTAWQNLDPRVEEVLEREAARRAKPVAVGDTFEIDGRKYRLAEAEGDTVKATDLSGPIPITRVFADRAQFERLTGLKLRGDGTRAAPVKVETPADIRAAEDKVDHAPSDAAKVAGNYAKGHVDFQGIPVTIETAKGGVREGPKDAAGEPAWRNTSPAAYGYVKRTVGADRENVDVYVGDHPESKYVFVVDQIDPATGRFDEHKAILGAASAVEARGIYNAGFSDGSGPRRMGNMVPMSVDAFKAWLKRGDTEAPASQHPGTRLSDALAKELENGAISAKQLQAMAERAYGSKLSEGKFDRSDMYDALELAVNKYIRAHADLFNPNESLNGARDAALRLEELKNRLPTQSVRAGEKDTHQQFSTPPDYSYAASWVAHIGHDDRVLEPSAGTGSLLVHAMNAEPRETVANEIGAKRADLVSDLRPGKVFRENAEQLNNILPDEVQPTVVVMNPPFSATAGRMGDKKVLETGAVHVEQALKRLQPGGRLVAIVGRGMGPEASRFLGWWGRIGKEYNVRANVGVGGGVYAKYGTSFGTRLLVIDKVPPTGVKPIVGEVANIPDLLTRIAEVRDDRPSVEGTSGKQVAAQPGGEKVAGGGEGAVGTGAAVHPPADVVGSGDGRPVAGAGEPVAGRPETGGGGDAGAAGGSGEGNAVVLGRPGRPGDVGAEPVAGVEPRPRKNVAGSGADSDGDLFRPTVGGKSALPEPGNRVDVESPAPEAHAAVQVDEAAADPNKGGEITDDVYEPYTPQRVSIPGAQEHPSKLVQSAAMASVLPPKADYAPRLPKELISSGALSMAQLEPIIYAGQAHAQMLPAGEDEVPRRRGIFIGDGTGVGKGRQIGGIILDNWNQGRQKAVWVSEKRPLINDARRDWRGLGQDPSLIFDAGKTKAGDKIGMSKGILFTSYDTLKSAEREGKDENGKTKFGRSRLDQIVDWVGKDFDGVIAFDEAHGMANAVPMKAGRGIKDAAQKALAGIELQKRLPNARVVYVSATGATEVSNLAYADRLGLWGRGTAFPTREMFINKIEQGGVAAMELVSRDMKALGHYIARNLSYDGVEYGRIEHDLTPDQRVIYDKLAEGWQVTLNNFEKALELTGAKKSEDGSGASNARAISAARSAFWGAHQRFFNQIITSLQMPSVVKSIEGDLREGRQSVLQLVNTNEAAQERAIAKVQSPEEMEDLDMTPRDQLLQLVEHSFPVAQHEEYMDDNNVVRSRPVVDSNGNPVENREALALRDQLLEQLASIRVPEGPLEILLNHFGTEKVAEVTGRKNRVVRKADEKGQVKTVQESRPASANIAEADAFQEGKKPILVFSQAGGTGRSYHADRDSPSAGARRVHYLVQAGWRADTAVQGFGRTHRTNQASAPIFNLVTTDLKGQKRFISSIARRLSQLGALTKGERRTGDQGMFSARDNLESREARQGLYMFYRDLANHEIPDLDIGEFQNQTGLRLLDPESGGLRKDLPEIPQFLNRLLSLGIDTQNKVFDAFESRMGDAIDRAAATGTLDTGVETVRGDRITKEVDQPVYRDPNSSAETRYVRLKIENRNHPTSYDEIMGGKGLGPKRPTFFAQNKQSGRVYAVSELAAMTDAKTGRIVEQYRLNGPLDYRVALRDSIDGYGADRRWTILDPKKGDAARTAWDSQIAKLPEFRSSPLHLITGAVLPIWDRLGGDPRVFRLQTSEGERMLGRVIPEDAVSATLKSLGAEGAAGQHSPEDVVARIMAGGRAELANGWAIKRSLVAGENRIEVVGPNFSHADELKGDGLFSEKIGWQSRYFIPTGEQAAHVLARVIERRPVTELTGGHEEEGQGQPAFQRPAFQAPEQAPTFYSALERGIEDAKQERAPAGSWKGYIRNLAGKGVKQEEVDWTGVNDWLDQQQGSVSKADLLQAIRENNVQMQEVVKGARAPLTPAEAQELAALDGRFRAGDMTLNSDDAGRAAELQMKRDALPDSAQPTQYSQYTLPGGENYREMLLTMGVGDAPFLRGYLEQYRGLISEINTPADVTAARRVNMNFREASAGLSPDQVLQEVRAIRAGRRPVADYRSSHWDEPNVLAHIRMDDRTDADGKRTLHVAEIQSDWHQKGRKEGYQTPDVEVRDAARLKEIEPQIAEYEAALDASVETYMQDKDRAAFDQRQRRLHDALQPLQEERRQISDRSRPGEYRTGVPNAPFKTSWHELAMKRILRYAAENGYDRVSWDTGETNAARYDLSKQVDSLSYKKNSDGTYRLSAQAQGRGHLLGENLTPPQLEEHVGKDVAQRIVDGAGKDTNYAANNQPNDIWKTLTGLDLKVGGEGMRGFYDKILPAFVNKYAKKWGAKVGETEVGAAGRAAKAYWTSETSGYWVEGGGPRLGPFGSLAEARAEADRINGDAHGTKAHFVDITPQMRESIMRGQPMFARAGEQRGAAPETAPLGPYMRAHLIPSDPYREHEVQAVAAVDEIAQRLAPGAKPRPYARLEATEATGHPGEVYGAYFRTKKGEEVAHVIAWSLASPDAEATFRHETVHYLRRAGLLDDQEWSALASHARSDGWLEKHRIDERYGDIPEDLKVEEAVAEEFSRWRQDGAILSRLPEWLRPIFYRIDLFRRQVAAAARRFLGQDATPGDIFTRMETGEVGRRAGADGQEATAPAFRQREEGRADLSDKLTVFRATEMRGKYGPGPTATGEPGPGLWVSLDRENSEYGQWHKRFTVDRPNLLDLTSDTGRKLVAASGSAAAGADPYAHFAVPSDALVGEAKRLGFEGLYARSPEGRPEALFFNPERVLERAPPGGTTAFQRPEDHPDMPQAQPEGRDYTDDLSDAIAAETGGPPTGTHERRSFQPPEPAQARNEYHFNVVNRDFTAPANLARMDWRSAEKWAAEQAKKDEAQTTLHSYREMMPTYLSATPEEARKIHAVEELARLNGRDYGVGDRDVVARNEGVRAALTKPGEAVTLDTPRLRQMYGERRQLFSKAWGDIIDATARKFGWYGEPTSKAILAKAAEAPDGAEQRRLGRVGSLIAALEEQQRAAYVPFMRFGDYYTAVRPIPGRGAPEEVQEGFQPVAHFSLIDSRTPLEQMMGGQTKVGDVPKAAQDHIAELRKTFPEDQYEIDSGYLHAKGDALRKLDIPAIEKLMMLVGNDVKGELRDRITASAPGLPKSEVRERAGALFDEMRETLLDQMYEELKSGAKRRAKNTPGYDPDFAKSTGVYAGWAANHAADLVHGDRIRQIDLNQIDQHPDPKVRQFWKAWDERNDTKADILDGALGKAKQAAFYWTLGANAATTMKILLHGPMLGAPALGAGVGLRRAGLAYLAAARNAVGALRLDPRKGIVLDDAKLAVSPEERALLDHLEQTGTLHAQGADELRAIQQRGEDALNPRQKFASKVLTIWSSNVAAADRLNRVALALASYREAMQPGAVDRIRKGWGNDEVYQATVERGGFTPEKFSRFMVDRAAGQWGSDNRLPVLRGKMGSLIGQFRAYELNYLSTLWQLMSKSGPEGKAAAAMMLGGLGMLGGAAALPFTQDAEKAAEAVYSLITGVAPNLEKHLQDVFKAMGYDDSAAEMLLHGVSRSALGVDLGSGLGFGDMLSRNTQAPIDIAGPAASILAGAPARAWQRARSGQAPSASVAEVMPNAVKNLLRGTVVYPEQGVVSLAGKQIMAPGEMTDSDRSLAAAGLEPAALARRYEQREEVYNAGEAQRHAASMALDQAANLGSRAIWAHQNGDDAASQELLAQQRDVIARAAKAGSIANVQDFIGVQLPKAIRDRLMPEQGQMARQPKAVQREFAQPPGP